MSIHGGVEQVFRCGLALLLAVTVAALAPSFAGAAGVAYPDAKWSEEWIDSPSSAGDATLSAITPMPSSAAS